MDLVNYRYMVCPAGLHPSQNGYLHLTQEQLPGRQPRKKQRSILIELNGQKLANSVNFQNLLNRKQNILYETYDPAIDEAIDFFNEKLDALRSMNAS